MDDLGSSLLICGVSRGYSAVSDEANDCFCTCGTANSEWVDLTLFVVVFGKPGMSIDELEVRERSHKRIRVTLSTGDMHRLMYWTLCFIQSVACW